MESTLAVRRWLPGYQLAWLRPDIVAGLTLAAYLLPAGIGDASLAGLPPEAGLYACLFSGLVFWLFCSSRQTVITVTSALSLLIGASVGELSGGDPARHAAFAACVTLMVAAIAFIAWVIRAGNAIGFFSETVLVGFKAGLALYLASTQLPKLFGFKGSHGDFWERSAHFIGHLGDTHPTSLLVGGAAFAALVAGKLWLKNRPVAFLVVVASIVAARLLDLQAAGVALLGEVPQGLPSSRTSRRRPSGAQRPSATGARQLRPRRRRDVGHRPDVRAEARPPLRCQPGAPGAWRRRICCRGSAAVSRSAAACRNRSSTRARGARTPLSGLVAAIFTLIVVLFASGLLRNLPQPVLAAIVLAAVMGLVDVAALRHIWHFSRSEFFVSIVALLGVLGAGPVNGVLLGAAISIVLLLRQASRPRVIELARVPGTTLFADRSRHPETALQPGVLVVRCESALLYFNVEFIRERVFEILQSRAEPIKLVVFALGTVPNINLAGAELLADLHRGLRARADRIPRRRCARRSP